MPEIWEKWYQEAGLQPVDLYIVTLSNEAKSKGLLPLYNEIMPKAFRQHYYYNNPILNIVEALYLIHPFAEKQDVLLGASTRLFSLLDDSAFVRYC
ncbi:MAG: hypothetical protein HC767_15650 [Akkermansiaceae bacterium]|nr:hypothetical protein [Akkermansiaceae bacterium]